MITITAKIKGRGKTYKTAQNNLKKALEDYIKKEDEAYAIPDLNIKPMFAIIKGKGYTLDVDVKY
jgi:hypothetical protein